MNNNYGLPLVFDTPQDLLSPTVPKFVGPEYVGFDFGTSRFTYKKVN